MSRFDRQNRGFKVIGNLGMLLIPIASAPLLLPLFSQSFSPTSTTATDPSPATPANNNVANNVSSVAQWEAEARREEQSKIPKAQPPTLNKTNKQQPQKIKRKRQPIAKNTQSAAPNLEIRVAIAQDADSLIVGSSTPAQVVETNGKVLRQLPNGQAFTAQPSDSDRITIGNAQLPNTVWIYPQKGGAIYVGDRWYRGKLLLVARQQKLLAVNYVDLEHYLASVVGSEMHASAPTEALKAQAVAARSYALVHMVRPANSWFNLGNTQRWQVYKGMNSEYNTTQKAVKDTAGQIISYQGGVVESLYAATDEIVQKAHGGKGMSQTGAYRLAAQGYNYLQILAHYYPKTATARLEIKP
ncbi:SpoIID/LytB domain-containing protein [Chroococcidiopsis sp.]|uniref:SpoIID/LytB domain-containing protein n=1 Tax=Chroococcidiopsis sp. TaxID=3088168 RepID=UPI003F3511D0